MVLLISNCQSKTTKGRDSVYLFEEVKAPEIVKEKAANLVVALPINDADNQNWQPFIYIPKMQKIPIQHHLLKKKKKLKKANVILR